MIFGVRNFVNFTCFCALGRWLRRLLDCLEALSLLGLRIPAPVRPLFSMLCVSSIIAPSALEVDELPQHFPQVGA